MSPKGWDRPGTQLSFGALLPGSCCFFPKLHCLDFSVLSTVNSSIYVGAFTRNASSSFSATIIFAS